MKTCLPLVAFLAVIGGFDVSETETMEVPLQSTAVVPANTMTLVYVDTTQDGEALPGKTTTIPLTIPSESDRIEVLISDENGTLRGKITIESTSIDYIPAENQ